MRLGYRSYTGNARDASSTLCHFQPAVLHGVFPMCATSCLIVVLFDGCIGNLIRRIPRAGTYTREVLVCTRGWGWGKEVMKDGEVQGRFERSSGRVSEQAFTMGRLCLLHSSTQWPVPIFLLSGMLPTHPVLISVSLYYCIYARSI
ncbi:hypothetical protein FA13DRAFT_385462 [Coprinellus micaceus]|uniref:Uncharacterized protein n=1 Tax=Coprinellus micaceus TaxID=71717 RepID=A0A4Y7TWL8_COPMI|nr:hypothetical protein FA13DRAFT_385462 [Coprinellus micaceus]